MKGQHAAATTAKAVTITEETQNESKKWKGNDEGRTETSWTHTHVRATCSKHMAALHQKGEGTL